MDKKRILVVDDDPAIVALLKGGLEHEGYEVSTASSDAEARNSLKKSNPDLILLDVNMPGMDGISLCRGIRNSDDLWNVPIIIITAYSDNKTFHDAMLFGATDFVTKPFDFESVKEKVRNLVSFDGKKKAEK